MKPLLVLLFLFSLAKKFQKHAIPITPVAPQSSQKDWLEQVYLTSHGAEEHPSDLQILKKKFENDLHSVNFDNYESPLQFPSRETIHQIKKISVDLFEKYHDQNQKVVYNEDPNLVHLAKSHKKVEIPQKKDTPSKP